MAEGEWVELKWAWGQLTAAILLGAEAAGDRERALEAMHDGIDTFPPAATTADELAEMSGDLVREAHQTLSRLLPERRYNLAPTSTSTRGRDDRG